jgi:putative phosphoesterase
LKIGIISDIHGYPEQFKKALDIFEGCSMILCAGDILYHGPRNPILSGYDPQGLAAMISENRIPMLISRGNCDAEVDMMVLKLPILSPAVVYEVDGTRFMVMHGHDVDENRLSEIADIYKVDIMITGHTHVRKWEKKDGILFINPGSVGVPKGDGLPSAAVFEDNIVRFINIENREIIEEVSL